MSDVLLAMQGECDRFERAMALFETCKEIEPKVQQIQKMWGEGEEQRISSVTLAFGLGSIDAYSINLYLGKNDGLNDFCCQRILDYVEEDDRFLDAGSGEYKELKWKSRNFHYMQGDKKTGVTFMVRFWYEGSAKCQVVETGKMIPETKVICE